MPKRSEVASLRFRRFVLIPANGVTGPENDIALRLNVASFHAFNHIRCGLR